MEASLSAKAEVNTYMIPAINMPKLQEEVDKINKKADKLGLPHVTLTVLNTVSEKRKDKTFDFEYDYVLHECTISGEMPELNGWTLLAAVEPQANGELLVREAPGQKCPEKYRKIGLSCDHCHTSRRRKAVYVLKHQEEGEKVVGRNCLADFLKHDSLEFMLAMFENLNIACGYASEASEDSFGNSRSSYLPISQFLATVSIVIRKLGWVSRTQVRENNDHQVRPTADIAWDICMFPEEKSVKEMVRTFELYLVEGDTEKAEAALAWAKSISPENAESNYFHGLGVCCRQEFVTYKMAGYVASAINAYNRSQTIELQKKERESQPVSKYVGTIKERRSFKDLTVVATHSYQTAYGPKLLIRFKDSSGNALVWHASGNTDGLDKIGDKVSIMATVSKHEEYKGVAQTILQRVKLSEPVLLAD